MKYRNLQAIKLCFLRYLLAGMPEHQAFDKLARVVGEVTMRLAHQQLQPVPRHAGKARSFVPQGQVAGRFKRPSRTVKLMELSHQQRQAMLASLDEPGATLRYILHGQNGALPSSNHTPGVS